MTATVRSLQEEKTSWVEEKTSWVEGETSWAEGGGKEEVVVVEGKEVVEGGG